MAAERWVVDSEPSRRCPVYTRLNADDVLADPISPLGASLAWVPQVLPGWNAGYVAIGSFTPQELVGEPTASCGFFFGHLYANLTASRLVGVRAGIGAEAVDRMWFAGHPDLPPHRDRPEDANAEATAAMAERMRWALSTTVFPELEEELRAAELVRASRPDLSLLSPFALVARARAVLPYERLVWRGHVVATSSGAFGPGVLTELLGAQEDPARVVALVGAAGDVDSAAPSYALWELSRVVRADPALGAALDAGEQDLSGRSAELDAGLARFVRDFGYRGPNEWDLASDTWETRPSLVLGLLDRLRQLGDADAPQVRSARREAEVAAAVADAVAGLPDRPGVRASFDAALASTRRFAAWRERGKSNCIKVLHEARVPLVELGRRLTAQGQLDSPLQVFMALEEELDAVALAPASMVGVLRQRERQWRALFGLELPVVVDGDRGVPDLSSLRHRAQVEVRVAVPGEVLTGVGASAGVARGRARVVLGTDALGAFQPGEVLVAPQTDPSWTPLFMVAAAAVVDVGAMGSHAMIVSRELGIPCAAGVTGASRRIPDGALVEVDGSAGTVTVLHG